VVPSATLADQPMAPSASSSQRQEIALKQVSHPIFINIICRCSNHRMTHFVFLFRNRILLTAYSPLLLISPRTKARKQVPTGQLGSHRQRSGPSWKNCRLSSIKIQHNWSMTLTQPRFYSRPSEARFLPMPRKPFSRSHIWKVVSCNIRGPSGASPIGLLRPGSLKR